jgi:hypothetical protein
VPVQFFFEDMPADIEMPSAGGFAEPGKQESIIGFINSSEGLQLNRAFSEIASPDVRRRVVDLVKTLAGQSG